MTDSHKNILLLVVILLVALGSCTQERLPCLTPKTASLKVRAVRKLNDTAIVDTALPAAVLVAVTDSGKTGYLYAGSSSFTLSLSPVADTAKWLISADTIAGSPLDTIVFRYTRRLQFLSNACGYTYYYNINSVSTTNHIIDSFLITDRNVTSNVNTSHLKVYIHSAP
jgi:hypothetical protein